VTVTYQPLAPPAEKLSVDPPTLLLHEGDTIFVELVDVPGDHVAAFWFPVDNSTLGPFASNFVTRKDGEGTIRLGGGTFGSTTIGTTNYSVRIWNAEGVLVASHDPSIDGLGRPPGIGN
jgi:hypothetical protein